MKKAICHIHTANSYDSIMPPSKIVDYAKKKGVEILLICDHDSFDGSRQAYEYASKNGIRIYIPFSAEIKTEYGDIIIILNDFDEELKISSLKDFLNLIYTVRKKKGIIILPHPYHHHQELEYIAKEVDCIEVFNARCSDEQNQRALELCINLGKIPFYGSDSHLYSEIDNVILGYPDSCKDYPFLHAPEVLVKKRTYNYKIRISSFIKAIKTLDFYPGIILIFSIIKWILIEKLLMKYHKVRRKNNDNY